MLDARARSSVLATGTFGIEEAHITEAPERCDPTDKWSPVACVDTLVCVSYLYVYVCVCVCVHGRGT